MSSNELEGRFPCDLHCHTTRSDGNDTPEELIERAASLGMHAIAITDHDIDPLREIGGKPAVQYAAEQGIKLLPGYEFSCDTLVDDVHICGYRMDWDHAELAAEIQAAKESKSNAYRALCEKLTELGMPVDWERDILNYTDPEGNPRTRCPDEVQRKQVFEAMAARGHAPGWSEAKLMVRDNPTLNLPRRKIDPVDAIRLIHTCGGIAVLAHPYLIDEMIDVEGRPSTRHAYIERLIDAGLDGIEARYTYDKTSYKGSMTPEAIEAEVRSRYGDQVTFISGGSDYHADHKKASAKVRYLGECGLTVGEFEATPLA